nr:GDP-mannose 4,6-dehydratase [Verrucomicrobium spinosum]
MCDAQNHPGGSRIASGQKQHLELGNLDALRDWGYAPDYVRAMHLMVTQPAPKDYVLATGHLRTVREFCAAAFSQVGLDWQEHVVSVDRFFRQEDAVPLVGDSSLIRAELGWSPKCTFDEMVREMVEYDLTLVRQP